MLNYLIKRVVIFIPTLFVISLLAFFLSIQAPGDSVTALLLNSREASTGTSDKFSQQKALIELRRNLGLDKPAFYFSFSNRSMPDTLYRIADKNQRQALERLCDHYGNWYLISEFYLAALTFERNLFTFPTDNHSRKAIVEMKESISSLLTEFRYSEISSSFRSLDKLLANKQFPELKPKLDEVKEKFRNISDNQLAYNKYIPVIYFYGTDNQYHHWMSNFIKGDFGISYQDKRPVASVLWEAVGWTMLLSSLSLFISYLIAIPLGVFSATNKGKRSERLISAFLFGLHSIPNFWLATLAILFLCGGDYLDWFPAFGLGSISADSPIQNRILETGFHLFLPLICWTYASLAYLSRQVRGGLLTSLNQDYIRTARAKGVDEKKVIWNHAFRNSLLPLITMFSGIFPLLISGSFIIENIFSIPGMGKISYQALIARDYPVVFALMMFSAILTMTGILIADLLYAFADPRISFIQKSK